MKKSFYNFFFPGEDETFIAYNSLRNGLALLHQDAVEKIENGDFAAISEPLRSELVRGGFLIEDDDFDERDLVFLRYRISQFAGNTLFLCILPTLSCNLNCQYCYEPKNSGLMKEEVQKKIVDFVRRYFQRGFRVLEVVWYGGEPLLCLEIIKKLSQELVNLCRRYRVRYSASMISNGTLLTEEVARELKVLKVKNIQVTIDGDELIHNQRRPYKNGSGSYQDIIKNVCESSKIIPINLRFNVDRKNARIALDQLRNLYPEISLKNGRPLIHFGHVRKTTNSCKCNYDDCLSSEEYWRLTLELNRYLLNLGYDTYPFPNLGFSCSGTKLNSFVIGPEGELYRCLNHVGEKKLVIGTIFDNLTLNPLLVSYLYYTCERDEQCLHCKVLPICMGGCVDLQIKNKRGEYPQKDCSRWRYYLEESLRDYCLFKMKSDVKNEAKS